MRGTIAAAPAAISAAQSPPGPDQKLQILTAPASADRAQNSDFARRNRYCCSVSFSRFCTFSTTAHRARNSRNARDALLFSQKCEKLIEMRAPKQSTIRAFLRSAASDALSMRGFVDLRDGCRLTAAGCGFCNAAAPIKHVAAHTVDFGMLNNRAWRVRFLAVTRRRSRRTFEFVTFLT
jgi:hypothetical protein